MTAQFTELRPVVRVRDKDLADEISCFWREPIRILEICILDLLEERGHRVLIKRQISRQQHVQDDSDRPDIRLLAVISILAKHLRRHVVGCATGGVQQLRARSAVSVRIADGERGEAEVRDLQVAVCVQQEVLREQRGYSEATAGQGRAAMAYEVRT